LEAAGVRPALAGEVGAAALMEASVLVAPDGDAEIWYAVLGRPGSEQLQPVVVFVENEPCGAVVVGATLGVPDEPEPVRGLLRDLAPDDRPAEPLDAAELTRRLRSALAHMERHEVPLDKEAASVLPLLERALTGHAGGLPRPFVALVDEAGPLDDEAGVLDDDEAGALDDDERAEAELRDAADDLTEAFAAALEEAGSPLAEHGPFVAHCMLDWKIGYADGALLRWTLGDLRELLLDWFPRKVTADDETIAVGVDAVAAFLRFLAGEELLDAPVPLASLEAAVERLRPRFEAACRDPRNWGLAKSMFAGMSADGVDPGDPEAVQDWIADFNARSREERDVILGPAMDRISAPGRAPAPKRAKRKAAKRARKRNRR
ncbi:MAG: hypothetical protein ACRDF0_06085, partial [Candidatus Limnocylindria bacterium]